MRVRPRVIAGAIVAVALGCANAQIITTVAGTGFSFPPTPLPAINAPAGTLADVAADSAGNIYVADNSLGNNLVYKVSPQGTLTVAAGNGIIGFSGDGGPATSAALDSPSGAAVDSFGNVYIADALNQRIRKVSPAGIITTVAGNGASGYSGDNGPAISAALNLIGYGGVAVDRSGNLFIVDQGNSRIRKVTTGGTISTVAGNGIFGNSGDGGPAISASLGINVNTYVGVALDAAGNLFIADYGNNRIRKVTSGGMISTVAGNGNAGFSGDNGPALSAVLHYPSGVAVDAAGNVFIADTFNVRIRKVTPGGIISTVAGSGTFGYAGDGGPAIDASLSLLTSVAVDSNDNLFIADSVNDRIRKVTSSGGISTFLGNGRFRFVGDGGPATSAALNFPSAIALDPLGNLYIADSFNDRIRKVSPGGTISTAAGSGMGQFSGDGGQAAAAGILFPYGVATDSSANLYIADTDNDRIRKVTTDGTINTVAGNGFYGHAGDGGQAVKADLDGPVGLVLDGSGNLFIADNLDNRIRKVTPAGIISTVAGSGAQDFSGDGGPAANAALNLPTGVAVDTAGNLFIADSGNDRIRMVTSDGNIHTVAGNGTQGYSGDGGLAINAALNLTGTATYDSIAVDAAGSLYIADYFNNRVRKVTPGGFISTVAGNGFYGSSGDGGPAASAALAFPSSVAVDSNGDIFISDTFNDRIRVVLASTPAVDVTPRVLQFTAASNGAPAISQTLSLTSAVEGLAFSVSVPSGVNWIQFNPSDGVSPRLIQVTADPTGLAPDTYQTTITITTPNANPAVITIAVAFQVTSAVSPALSIDKPSLSFPFPSQGAARSQTITVSNTGGGALPFSVAAATDTGGAWLSVSPSNGQALPASPAALTVAANPAGLAPGAYVGRVTVTAGAQIQTVPVTMTINALSQAILLSQSGLSFLGVQSGGVVPAQSFGVQNLGVGVVNWTTSTSTLAGGSGWLKVSPSAGSSDAAASTSPRVTVSVNPSALTAGTYYGLVRVDAPGAANSPQVLTVFLQVLPANTQVAGVVEPSHLIFTAIAGGESPGSQLVQVYNIASAAKSFQSQVSGDAGLSVITLPQDATLNPAQPTAIVVQPLTAGLRTGVYNGALTLQFSDGTVNAVQLTVIVSNVGTAPASSSTSGAKAASVAAACTPTKLFPALTTLGQTFTVSAGWPAALAVSVKDDCGMPMQAKGSVTVDFSNGAPTLSLESQGAGSWENTWPTGSATASGITLKIHADNLQGLTGDQVVAGNLASQEQPPVFDRSGITSAAVVQAFTALAPGSAIAIYGSRLAESTAQAATLPLPSQLVDTQVFIAGTTPGGTSTGLVNLPLFYVSQNQVNAMVPYEVSVNTTVQLLVQRGLTYSTPVQIDVAQAQPAMFSSGGVAGAAGLIYVYPLAGGPPHLVSPSAPAHAGDTLVLYCAGLGAINPPVADGAAPGQQLSNTVSAAQLTIGDRTAHVAFAGLAPGFAGLYQVNAVVPSGVQTGASVPIVLTIDGQASPQITTSIE